jgi:O-acetyl-ADP-ribose deacetylase (regulator of RNase III)
MVSPANSFGIMDGGLDAAIRATLGRRAESAVQSLILEKQHGEFSWV